MFGHPGPPLLGQRLPVDQDQGRGGVPGHERAGHDRLTRPGGSDQHAQIFVGQVINRALLVVPEPRGERETPLWLA
jgi:hypothetical protein